MVRLSNRCLLEKTGIVWASNRCPPENTGIVWASNRCLLKKIAITWARNQYLLEKRAIVRARNLCLLGNTAIAWVCKLQEYYPQVSPKILGLRLAVYAVNCAIAERLKLIVGWI